jgi:hypothetical protein
LHGVRYRAQVLADAADSLETADSSGTNMSLAIHPLGPASVTLSSTAIKSVALSQAVPADSGSTITAVTPTSAAANSAKLDAALQALGSAGKLSSDLQNVASALVPSMQKIIEDRPDLANANFDFQSDNGSIKVVSSSLSDSDKAWLEKTLNANKGLVDAVQTFHDDATKSYALWAQADGQTLSSSDTHKVSQLADQAFSFMSMFQHASQTMLQNMFTDGSYTTSNGAPIDFRQSVNSPLSFLVFQKSNRAIVEGTDTYTSPIGHRYYGAMKGNFFFSSAVIPDFMPSMSSNSVGVDAKA